MLGHLTDMARDASEKTSGPSTVGCSEEKYPYGLRISLTHDDLDKLDLDISDWEVGATFHLHALAKVVSISSNETSEGEQCYVGLQITHLAGLESEDAENEEEESEEQDLSKHGYLRYNHE